jgi:hypothetical protein
MNSHRLPETGSLQHEVCTLPVWVVLIAAAVGCRAQSCLTRSTESPAAARQTTGDARIPTSRAATDRRRRAVATRTQRRLGFG